MSVRSALLLRVGVAAVLAASSAVSVPATAATTPVFAGPLRTVAGATNWAGNVARGHTYIDARGHWVVPPATLPSGGSVLHWIGIGQGSSATRPLVQAGTATDVGSGSYVWIETYPLNGLVRVPYFGTVDNHLIGVHIHFSSATSISIHLHDSTNGRDTTCRASGAAGASPYCTVKTTSGMAPDGTAEWITESVGSKPVAKFGAVKFAAQGYYSASIGWVNLGALPHTYAIMYNSNNQPRVAPGNISSDNQSFDNYWYRAT